MKNEKAKKTLKQTGTHLLLILIGFLWSYPFLWMISASFKTPPDFFGSKLNLFPKTFTIDNILRVWTKGHFNIYFLNTVIVTFFSVFLVLTMTRSAGYVFGRYKFFGKKVILSIFLASISIPLVSTLIPVYEVVKSMGLVGTRLGLILSGAGGAHVIFLLLFSSYYQQIPKELEEAAHMDGCGFYRTYSDIMKPMSTPISMTVIIMETIWTWNAFLLPLVLTLNNPSSRTLAVGLYAFRGENTIDWTGIAAGATISVIPIIILFICLQKYVVEGVSGAVKS
jgi:raffinose/stachyose/melibiose transport system permease protein